MPIVGAPGTPNGVTLVEGEDAALVPMALRALTVQVIATPAANPVRVIGEFALVALCGPQVAV